MGLEMKYFILKPRAKSKDDLFARASQEAMFRFSEIIEEVDSNLASEVHAWASREVVNQQTFK